MAKLNKNEIEAVANKAHRALEEAAKAKREEIRRKYTPDSVASELLKLAKEKDQHEIEIERLNAEKNRLRSQIQSIFADKYDYYCHYTDYNSVLDTLVSRECQLPNVPSKESIIDDVTIAAIDRDFDTAKFINDLVAKFNA